MVSRLRRAPAYARCHRLRCSRDRPSGWTRCSPCATEASVLWVLCFFVTFALSYQMVGAPGSTCHATAGLHVRDVRLARLETRPARASERLSACAAASVAFTRASREHSSDSL